MYINTIPVLSTEHIKEDTLQKIKPLGMVAQYEHGAFVFIGEGGDFIDPDHDSRLTQLAPEMQPVIDWFRQAFPEENWIRFDADGDTVETLPTYKW